MNEFLSLILSVLAISNISCKTQFGPCGEDDYQKLDEFKGKNIFLLKKAQVEEKLTQNFKNGKVVINKVLPVALSVFIEKRRGYAGIKKEGQGGIFIISKDGTTLSLQEESAIPTLTVPQDFENPVVGQKVNKDYLAAARILLLASSIKNVKKADLEKNKFIVFIDETEVIFPLDRDPQILAGSLQLILAQSKMNKKIPASIDLRYKNPVLRY